jgi:tight adherence protein B
VVVIAGPALPLALLAGAVAALPARDAGARVRRLGRRGPDATPAGPGERRRRLPAVPPAWRRPLFAAGATAATAAFGVLGIAAAAVGGLGAVLFADRRATRRDERRRAGVLRAVQVVAAELEAGATVESALGAAAEVDDQTAAVWRSAAQRAASGDDFAEVLVSHPDPALVAVGHAGRIATVTGAPLTGVLAQVAAELRLVEQRRRAVAAAVAGPRASASLLAGLPVVGLVLGASMGARPWVFLLHHPTGRLVACAGVLLDVAGVLWMRHLLHRAVA